VFVVATPNSDHYGTTSRLLAAGRAVIVEKPVCENLDELHKLAKRARTGGIFFHRFIIIEQSNLLNDITLNYFEEYR
jgi:hypothetical protein